MKRFFCALFGMASLLALLYYGKGDFTAPAPAQQSTSPSVATSLFKNDFAYSSNRQSAASPKKNEVIPVYSQGGNEVNQEPPDTSQLLDIIEDGQDVEKSREAIVALLSLIESGGVEDPNEAFKILLVLKDLVHDEDLQSVLKKIRDFAEVGGNQAIVDSFLASEGMESHNRGRILSYIDSQHPLDTKAVGQLTEAYEDVGDEGVRSAIARTLAMAGDEAGVAWIIDRANNASSFPEWQVMINSLTVSQSKIAFDYLHILLNSLAPDASSYQEQMEIVRQAISSFDQMKK